MTTQLNEKKFLNFSKISNATWANIYNSQLAVMNKNNDLFVTDLSGIHYDMNFDAEFLKDMSSGFTVSGDIVKTEFAEFTREQGTKLDYCLELASLQSIQDLSPHIEWLQKSLAFMPKDKFEQQLRPQLFGLGISHGVMAATDAHVMIYKEVAIPEKWFINYYTLKNILTLKPAKLFMFKNLKDKTVLQVITSENDVYYVVLNENITPPDYRSILPTCNYGAINADNREIFPILTHFVKNIKKQQPFIEMRTDSDVLLINYIESFKPVSIEKPVNFNCAYGLENLHKISKILKKSFKLYFDPSNFMRAAIICDDHYNFLLMPVYRNN